MRVLFDAKWLCDGHPSGKRFTAQVLPRLIELRPDWEWLVAVRNCEPEQLVALKTDPRVTLIRLRGPNALLNIFVLPIVARRLLADVMVTQGFAALSGRAQLLFVFDMMFLDHPAFFSRTERLYLGLMPRLARFASKVATISKSSESMLKTHGVVRRGQPSEVIPLAGGQDFQLSGESRDEEAERVRAVYGLPPDFVLYVGRMNVRKNVACVREAMTLLQSPAPLVLAGPANRASPDHALGPREVRLGHVPACDLPGLMASATIFVFPSLAEGFGLPPLEAMQVGTPVLVSDIPVFREVYGAAVAYADPTSPASFAEAIEALLSDPKMRADYAEAGRDRAQRFTWAHTAELLATSIEETAEARLPR